MNRIGRILCAAFLWATLSARGVMALVDGTAFSSVLRFGSGAEDLRAQGRVQAEVLDTEMGSFHESFAVHTVAGKGSSLAFDIKVRSAGAPVILEFQEIHNRRPDAYGYMIVVNEQDVYFRTYQELGAGPCHFFVAVPPSLTAEAGTVRVELRHEGGGPFSLGAVWVYEDFFGRVAGPEQVFKPMGLLLPPNAIKLGDEKGPKDEAWWLKRYEEQKRRFAGLQDYEPIGTLALGGSYGGTDPHQGRSSLLQGLRLSGRTGMPGEMMLNGLGWFSGPTGPDGLGGFFSDIRYNKPSYNKAKGVYQISTPNMWGNTPAFTLRDTNLNYFLERRFQQMMEGAPEELAKLRLAGTPAQPILIREFSPASGEITDEIIKAAARDGLVLDPADGMSWEERLWMHRDAVRTWQEYADSLRRAMGRDIAVVDNGRLVLPGEQSFDNFFAHPNFMTDDPAGDPRWGGGQHGMVDGLWSSGEIGATSGHRDIGVGAATKFRDVVMYDYLPARGKFASINLERTMLKDDFSVLRMYYERGAQFVCLFNADDGDESFVRQVDGIADDPASPPPHSQPLVTMEPLEVPIREGDTPFFREELFRLSNAGDPFMSGLSLALDGRISPGEANRIEVLLGPAPDRLQMVATLTEKDLPDPDHWTPQMTSLARLDLGTSMVGRTQAFLKIMYHAEGAADAAFLIGREVQTRWTRASGYLQPSTLTRKEARTLQLWLQERSVAARLLRYYREAGGEDDTWRRALALFEAGWYARVRRLLGPAMSEILPARYLVRGGGALGRHPVQVTLPSTNDLVLVTLEEVSPDRLVLVLRAETNRQACTVRVAGRDPAKSWRIVTDGSGRYTMTSSGTLPGDDRVSFRNGVLEEAIDHVEPAAPSRTLPSRLVARYRGGQQGRITVEVQDLALMDYGASVTLPLAKGMNHVRKAAVLEHPALAAAKWPEAYDEVVLSLNETGEVTAMESRYGYDRGRIKAFHPPVAVGGASNGAIELENGNRYELVFEKGVGQFNTVALQGSLVGYEIHMLADAIKPGHEVEVFFSPYAAAGGTPRIIRVEQPRRLLLEVDYTKDENGSWKQAAHEVKGLEVRLHKPEPNYLYKVEMPLLRPARAFVPGHAVYHITNDVPLQSTYVEFAARAFENSSRVTFHASPDGVTWTRIGQFDNTWQNNISQSLGSIPFQFLDLTPVAEGRTSFFLKVELAVNSADHRFCLQKLRVATEVPGPVKATGP